MSDEEIPVVSEEEALAQFHAEHAAEIAAEQGKGFELVGGTPEETEQVVAAVPANAPEARISPLQKIAKLTVGERVKLAMIGSKEERNILVRDGSRIVSSAVLASPKLSEQEVETIAAMKNVQESVLRDIYRNRKFMKKYSTMKALINNPRCPLDLSLEMLKRLIATDLKALALNKGVPETLKKTALRMSKEKEGKK